MSGSKINTYSSSYTSLTNYATCIDHQRLGFQSLTLTNMSTTSVPAIAGGSVCEINGSLYEFSTDETISSTGVTESSGVYWIKLCPTSSVVTAEFTTTYPQYVDSKHGWFASTSDSNRYVNYFVSKSSNFYFKGVFNNNLFQSYTIEYTSSGSKSHTPSTLVASYSTLIESYYVYVPLIKHKTADTRLTLRGWLSTSPGSGGYGYAAISIGNPSYYAFVTISTAAYDMASTTVQTLTNACLWNLYSSVAIPISNDYLQANIIWYLGNSSAVSGTLNGDYLSWGIYVK